MGKKKFKSRAAKQQGTPIESSASDSVDDDIIDAAMSSMPQAVFMKVCRLCETKDGPFLNIFGADKVTAKKIEVLLPFGVAENDELPQKICFRCSAKVEELFEFIQKCIKTQESLRTAMGKKGPLVTKMTNRALWEEKLNKTKLSIDDICDATIKKAMEWKGIIDIPLNIHLQQDKHQQVADKKVKGSIESSAPTKKDKEVAMSSRNSITFQSDNEADEINLKQVKVAIEKCDDKLPTRTSRSKKSEVLLEGLVEEPKKTKQYPSRKFKNKVEPVPVSDETLSNDAKQTDTPTVSTVVSDGSKDKSEKENSKVVPAKVTEPPTPPPPINIMDHVSTIKVNGVGTLFLCKLCNRNFLKKDVVMSHGCAKNNVPKDSFLQNHIPVPDIPKPSTVKYITMNKDFKKPVITENKLPENKPPEHKLPENKPPEKKLTTIDCIRVNIPVQAEVKFKPKVGPASKVRNTHLSEVPNETTPPPTPAPKLNVSLEDKPVMPSLQFPGIPSLNSRYKLVPGPNNTFTLIEDSASQNEEKPVEENKIPQPKSKKRKHTNISHDPGKTDNKVVEREAISDVIDLDNNIPPHPPAVKEAPYPVGLFQTVPHHSGVFASNAHPQPPAFTTPAMKKQSYTIVQTGNPSKLLISTKPQPVTEEPSRKKSRKAKPEVREASKEPFSVTIEDNAPPKDQGFFTFINVDPLLQPSYVLPTDNIIQESQISTSTPASKGILDNKDKEKYSCNMCGEKFSREKKLLSHIQSHYNQMDEEDQLRAEKSGPKRKTRKS